jgi:hypothetical protein
MAGFPDYFRNVIWRIRFSVQYPKLFSALNQYKYSDKHLKFVHITLEKSKRHVD